MESKRILEKISMRVLITGIRGFVGQNLSNYLGLENVLGISRESSEQNISYKELSVQKFSNASCFIHLAGKAHDLKQTSGDSEYFEVNTELTKKLFNQFLESSCETFIYMSSVKACADEVEGVLTEDKTPNPVTAYGKSKLAAEQYILDQKLPENKRVYILRPCMVHGPGNKGNLNLLYNFVSKGIPYPFGKFQNQRSYVSVENLCFIIKELINNKNIENGIYHIADDKAISTNQLVKTIGETIRKSSKILSIPKFWVLLLTKIGDVIPIPINSERLQKLTENYVVSNQKIKEAIGKELPLSVLEGIKKTIKSFI